MRGGPGRRDCWTWVGVMRPERGRRGIGEHGMGRGYESTRWVLRVEEPTTDRLERKFDDDEGGRPTKLTNGGGGAMGALIG